MSHAIPRTIAAACAVAALVVAAPVFAAKPGAVVVAGSERLWTEAGVPGVSIAVVDGDLKKGGSHFFLKYAKGVVTPPHHHSADHHVVVLEGTLLLTVDGVERRLGPGSYFKLTGKKSHVAKVEGDTDATMFVDARSPWDVVPEAAAKK